MTINPEIAWEDNGFRIVIRYEPFVVEENGLARKPKPNETPTILRRLHTIERIATRDALGQPNWQRVFIQEGMLLIIEEFLNKLGTSKEKLPEKE